MILGLKEYLVSYIKTNVTGLGRNMLNINKSRCFFTWQGAALWNRFPGDTVGTIEGKR